MVKVQADVAQRLTDEKIYEAIGIEMLDGEIKPGLWTQAVSRARGDESKVEAIYIELRHQNIIDEAVALPILEKQKQRKRDKQLLLLMVLIIILVSFWFGEPGT